MIKRLKKYKKRINEIINEKKEIVRYKKEGTACNEQNKQLNKIQF